MSEVNSSSDKTPPEFGQKSRRREQAFKEKRIDRTEAKNPQEARQERQQQEMQRQENACAQSSAKASKAREDRFDELA